MKFHFAIGSSNCLSGRHLLLLSLSIIAEMMTNSLSTSKSKIRTCTRNLSSLFILTTKLYLASDEGPVSQRVLDLAKFLAKSWT